ncbi:MAG: WecB/TagA/CpsF family glycosyltransferase [Roseiflexaceae bacterium]
MSITILQVRIDTLREAEVLERVAAYIASGEPHQIVTVNPEFVVEARHNIAFRRVLAAADLATPDGSGLQLVARMRGTPIPERVTGVALVEAIARMGAAHGWRLFLLGAAPRVAEQAAIVLQSRYPGIQIAGCYSGSPKPADEPDIRAQILAARPDVLFVAYGHPSQDMWIARNQPVLRVPVAIGVGGTFDELAGVVPIAPAWMQRIGFKWLYRLLTQPQRWRRIMNAVPIFLGYAIWEQLTNRRDT